MSEKRIKCWHFLQENKRLRWGSKEVVEVGKTYTAEGPIEMCKNGMHGSRKLLDVLYYAPGSILCEVEIWGEVEEKDDKLVGRHRKVLSMFDATAVLRAFARKCALDVIHLWDAPDVVVRYLKTGDESLRDAAWNARTARTAGAARDAAWNARTARTAARAAWDAAWAARTAAGAAWDAAWVARDVAWAAAAAARDAWAAAWAKQERRLVQMVRKAMK